MLYNKSESSSGSLWINDTPVCLVVTSEGRMWTSSLGQAGRECDRNCLTCGLECIWGEAELFFFKQLELVCISGELLACQIHGDPTEDPEMWAQAGAGATSVSDLCMLSWGKVPPMVPYISPTWPLCSGPVCTCVFLTCTNTVSLSERVCTGAAGPQQA